VLETVGDPAAARDAYQRAIDSGHPTIAPTSAIALGILLQNQGNLQQARTAYLTALGSGYQPAEQEATRRLADLP
jgi:hypothetical protein